MCSLIDFSKYSDEDTFSISTPSTAIAKQKQHQEMPNRQSVMPVNAIITKNELKKKQR
jgi:hypothetical protein